MTAQKLDSIFIDGRWEWLVEVIPVLPNPLPGHRIGFGIVSSHFRTLAVEAGRVTADTFSANPRWRPDMSGKRRCAIHEEQLRLANEAWTKMVANRKPEPIRDQEFHDHMDKMIAQARAQRRGGRALDCSRAPA